MKILDNVSSFTKNVTDLMWNFIANREQYPSNAMLAVQPDVMVTVIDDPNDCRYCDLYDPMLLISKDQNGKMMPSKEMIKNMASRYFEN